MRRDCPWLEALLMAPLERAKQRYEESGRAEVSSAWSREIAPAWSERAGLIQRALFAGGEGPKATFSVRLAAPAAGVSRVIMTIDDQSVECHPSEIRNLSWTARDTGVAEVRVEPDLWSSVRAEGAFGVLRLLEAGAPRALSENQYEITLSLSPRPAARRRRARSG
jgi:type VI protein secretion system component VasK